MGVSLPEVQRRPHRGRRGAVGVRVHARRMRRRRGRRPVGDRPGRRPPRLRAVRLRVLARRTRRLRAVRPGARLHRVVPPRCRHAADRGRHRALGAVGALRCQTDRLAARRRHAVPLGARRRRGAADPRADARGAGDPGRLEPPSGQALEQRARIRAEWPATKPRNAAWEPPPARVPDVEHIDGDR